MRTAFRSLLTALLLTTLVASAQQSETPSVSLPPASIQRVDPPLFGFYGKLLTCGGIQIRSSAKVDDRALVVACAKIDQMLAHLPIASANLSQRGAELHIIGKQQGVSSLPEWHGEHSAAFVDNVTGKKTNIDKRTRGEGGVYSSCAEENLLGLRGDRYGGSDTCVHEFAHTIMAFGVDEAVRQKIIVQYERSTAQGLWKKSYEALNPQEYFAGLSMWYFGTHGDFVSRHIPAPGLAALRSYDPGGYRLLDEIYSGRDDPAPIHVIAARVAPDEARSSNVRDVSRMIVANNTGQTVKLFWLDYSGNLRNYGEVYPYDRRYVGTFISHVWIFQDASGKTLARYQADSSDCEVVLNPSGL